MEADEQLEEQIKAQVEEWSSNSNDCFTVTLLRGDGSEAASFQPQFTYPIFGEEEAIFGYQDLQIDLTLAAHNARPHLEISYGSKFPAMGEVKPTDIHEALRDFLPSTAFTVKSVEDAIRDDDASSFQPPGEKVHEYRRQGQRFEIWCSPLSDPAARQLLENMQILMPMFIEGGSILQLEQDWTTQRWKLFLLYALDPRSNAATSYSPYSLVGYGTSYRIFTLPDRFSQFQPDSNLFSSSSQSLDDFLPPPESALPNDLAPTANRQNMESPLGLPSRERLSQFLILPDYQHAGHGSELYHSMYATLTLPTNVREFTVEDPNEAFDDLRDLCDLLHLRAHDRQFADLRINIDIPSDKLASSTDLPTDLIVPSSQREDVMNRTKIMQRQFDRLVEMHTLSFIPPKNRSRHRVTKREKATNADDKAYYFWRLYVKQRLYIFNRDQLSQLERTERIEKLESALDAVEQAYSEMIEKVEKIEKKRENDVDANEDVVEGAVSNTPRKSRGKRKVVDDEDDDDEEEDAMGHVNGHKKLRVG